MKCCQPTVAFSLLPANFFFFLFFFNMCCLVAKTVIFTIDSCHPSIVTGLVAGACSLPCNRPGFLRWEEIRCNVSGWGGRWWMEKGGGSQGASCQEIWHQVQGWHLELTQSSDCDNKRPESTPKMPHQSSAFTFQLILLLVESACDLMFLLWCNFLYVQLLGYLWLYTAVWHYTCSEIFSAALHCWQ